MSFFKKYVDKLYIKQWNIGFVREGVTMHDVIRKKMETLPIDWMVLPDKYASEADPFIFETAEGNMAMLFEDFTTHQYDGKISLTVFDKSMKSFSRKVVLQTDHHLSYPSIFRDNGKMYIFPEAAHGGSLIGYEYNEASQTIVNKREVMKLPVIDPTIIKYEANYWLFGTLYGDHYNSHLNIWYADSLFGPFTAHPANPVDMSIASARPAGAIIEVDGELYRPGQNCTNYYGESITIKKITKLSKTDYKEEDYMSIYPTKTDAVNYGIHTINSAGNRIVVDGLKNYAEPWKQLKKIIKNKINR